MENLIAYSIIALAGLFVLAALVLLFSCSTALLSRLVPSQNNYSPEDADQALLDEVNTLLHNKP